MISAVTLILTIISTLSALIDSKRPLNYHIPLPLPPKPENWPEEFCWPPTGGIWIDPNLAESAENTDTAKEESSESPAEDTGTEEPEKAGSEEDKSSGQTQTEDEGDTSESNAEKRKAEREAQKQAKKDAQNHADAKAMAKHLLCELYAHNISAEMAMWRLAAILCTCSSFNTTEITLAIKDQILIEEIRQKKQQDDVKYAEVDALAREDVSTEHVNTSGSDSFSKFCSDYKNMANSGKLDYTSFTGPVQLAIPLDTGVLIPNDDIVHLVNIIVNQMDLRCLYRTYDRVPRNPNPATMLKLALYSRIVDQRSTRDVEKACHDSLRFIYLLNGQKAPDHTTYARFLSNHFTPCAKELMAQIVFILLALGEVDKESCFMDGTKIESVANRYTFVWKKSVLKRDEKLQTAAEELACELEKEYGPNLFAEDEDGNRRVTMRRLNKLLKTLKQKMKDEKIETVSGKGHRKTDIQKHVEKLQSVIDKLNEYMTHLEICGKRGSYSKTDPDATFMRMKEDHMKNGQLKPGYNVQHLVNSGYIIWVKSSPDPADQQTLRPTLTEMYGYLGFYFKNMCADAGYHSEENLKFLESIGVVSYIKPMYYEKMKTKKWREDIGRRENMTYDAKRDVYICANGRELKVSGTHHSKTKTGYVRELTVYTCADCSNCPHKTKCIHGNNCKTPMEKRTKSVSVSKEMLRLDGPNTERIVSDEGKLQRVNRSIFAEGSFAQVKSNHQCTRYRHRGMEKTEADSILNAMGVNLLTLHNRIRSGKVGLHLHPLKEEEAA